MRVPSNCFDGVVRAPKMISKPLQVVVEGPGLRKVTIFGTRLARLNPRTRNVAAPAKIFIPWHDEPTVVEIHDSALIVFYLDELGPVSRFVRVRWMHRLRQSQSSSSSIRHAGPSHCAGGA